MTHALDRRALMTGAFGATAALALPAEAAQRRFFERIDRPIGLQLFALGEEAMNDLDGALKRVAKIGYRDIELGLKGRDPAAVRRSADAAGLQISSVHVVAEGPQSISSDPQQLADMLGAVGARQLVVPVFPIPSGFKMQPGDTAGTAGARLLKEGGVDMWKGLAQLLNERAAALKPHGIAVGYHNHSLEFKPVGSTTGWEILARETDPSLVHFEADIGWIVSAGLDPLAFFKRYSGRVRQAHVKDVKVGFKPSAALGTDPTEVGSGQIDWARVLPAAYAAGVRNFYVEQEPPFSMPRFDSVAKSYAYLSQLRA